MATNKSTERILEFIQEQDKPVTKNQIIKSLGMNSLAVRECVRVLADFGKIELITNGKFTLIKNISEDIN